MFENFTDRSKKVMALANQEALNFNHEYIGTEHVSSQSKVQEIEKPWKIPRKDMDLITFLQIQKYKVVEGPTDYFDISKVEDSSDIKIGKLNFDRDGYIRVIYDLNNVKQIGHALDLRDIFDNNGVKYQEEPPSSEILEALKKPVKDVASLIDRLEKRV